MLVGVKGYQDQSLLMVKLVFKMIKQEEIILKWLNKEFSNLTKIVVGERTTYIDNDKFVLFYYYENIERYLTRAIYVNYERLWELIKIIFGLESWEIREVLIGWFKVSYNLDYKTINPVRWYKE